MALTRVRLDHTWWTDARKFARSKTFSREAFL